ncbi:hypothetical protein HGB24_00150 [Candidatus Saccharibacteria bacterium]|nr:hypothetical protein [Candidatus Saccharibacteria bacterium]
MSIKSDLVGIAAINRKWLFRKKFTSKQRLEPNVYQRVRLNEISAKKNLFLETGWYRSP